MFGDGNSCENLNIIIHMKFHVLGRCMRKCFFLDQDEFWESKRKFLERERTKIPRTKKGYKQPGWKRYEQRTFLVLT